MIGLGWKEDELAFGEVARRTGTDGAARRGSDSSPFIEKERILGSREHLSADVWSETAEGAIRTTSIAAGRRARQTFCFLTTHTLELDVETV